MAPKAKGHLRCDRDTLQLGDSFRDPADTEIRNGEFGSFVRAGGASDSPTRGVAPQRTVIVLRMRNLFLDAGFDVLQQVVSDIDR